MPAVAGNEPGTVVTVNGVTAETVESGLTVSQATLEAREMVSPPNRVRVGENEAVAAPLPAGGAWPSVKVSVAVAGTMVNPGWF